MIKKIIKHMPRNMRETLEIPLNFNYYIEEHKWMKNRNRLNTLPSLIPKPSDMKTLKFLICSSYLCPNFGDRLGYFEIINMISKLEYKKERCIEIFHDDLARLHYNPEDFDLLIIGNGNSIFPPVFLNKSLIDYAKKAERSIGIFGIQYYSGYSQTDIENLISLIEQTEFVFIRYKNELNQLKKICNKKEINLLGDWLINQFPITSWQLDKTKKITAREPFRIHSIDFYIREIQLYRRVYSERLHTLLCALCSSEEVAYREQHDYLNADSGKFNALLTDIFNKKYPPNSYFKVEKNKVWKYKKNVLEYTKNLIEKLSEIF